MSENSTNPSGNRSKTLFLGLLCIICLNLLQWALFFLDLQNSWTAALYDIADYFLIFALLYTQRKNLNSNNIDSWSMVILFLFPFISCSADDPNWRKFLFYGIYYFGVVVFLFFWSKSKDKSVQRISSRQIFFMLGGFLLGLLITAGKAYLGQPELLSLAVKKPFEIIYSSALSLSLCKEEFIYRGFLWGYLRMKRVPDNIIILISTFIWVGLHFNAYGSMPEIVSIIIPGLLIGFLVKKTKSISIGIGVHSGYCVLLILKSFFGGA